MGTGEGVVEALGGGGDGGDGVVMGEVCNKLQLFAERAFLLWLSLHEHYIYYYIIQPSLSSLHELAQLGLRQGQVLSEPIALLPLDARPDGIQGSSLLPLFQFSHQSPLVACGVVVLLFQGHFPRSDDPFAAELVGV